MIRILQIALLCCLIATPSLAADITDEFVMAVAGYDSCKWVKFEERLRKDLGQKVKILPVKDINKIIDGLKNDKIDAAILSPYRYVLLTTHSEGFKLIAKLRRGGTSTISKETMCTADKLNPEDHYQSIIVSRVNKKKWPLSLNNIADVKLGVRNMSSTSSYLFPAEFLKSTVERIKPGGGKLIKVIGFNDKQKIDTAATLSLPPSSELPSSTSISSGVEDRTIREEASCFSIESIQNDKLLNDLLSDKTSTIDYAGVSSHWLNKYVGDKKNLQEVWRSTPIPYDAVVLSDEVDPIIADRFIRSMLSTQTLGEEDRNELFRIESTTVSLDREEQRMCGRVPDIHSFVPATDEEFDSIRKTAVSLSGGIPISVALSNEAHWGWPRDIGYFRQLKSRLMRPGKTTVEAGKNDVYPSVYLDYTLSRSSFSELYERLDEGDYNIVELNAFEAGRAIYNQAGSLLSHAEYRDKKIRLATDRSDEILESGTSYRMVLLTQGNERFTEDYVSRFNETCIAVSRDDVSSVQRYALYHFDKERKTPIPTSSLLEVDGPRGILAALRDFYGKQTVRETSVENVGCNKVENGAAFGLMSEFEFINLRREIDPDGVHAVPIQGRIIPNAMFLISDQFLPSNFSNSLLPSLNGQKFRSLLDNNYKRPQDALIKKRTLAIEKLKREIQLSSNYFIELNECDAGAKRDANGKPCETGFTGLTVADRSTANELASIHSHFARNYAGIVFSSLGLVLLGCGVMAWRTYRHPIKQQFLFEKLELGGDKRVQNFIHYAIATSQWLKDGSSKPLLQKIYEKNDKDITTRIIDLNARILALLAFFRAEPHVDDYLPFLNALMELAEEVEDIVRPVREWEESHQTDIPSDAGEASNENSQILEQGFKVALEMARGFMGVK